MLKLFQNQWIVYGLLTLPAVVSLFLPTLNSTQDGYGYAADALWVSDLFAPHHLLYTAQLYFFSLIFNISNTLALGKIINSVYLLFSSLILFEILKSRSKNVLQAFTFTFFACTSFASLRFATENETYIVPIFFSLIGIFFMLKNGNKHILLSSLFLSIACLFHQLHFFWYLGGFFYIFFNPYQFNVWDKVKNTLLFVLPALVVPFVYILVLIFYLKTPPNSQNLIQFVFNLFYTGSATVDINILYVVRFLISLIRTFVQIHPTQWLLIQNYPYLYFVLGIIILPLLFFLIKILKNLLLLQLRISIFFKSILLISIFILMYSLIGGGNSEFMVALPFLLSILANDFNGWNLKYWIGFSLLIFFYNTIFGLLPNYIFCFQPFQKWTNLIEKQSGYYLMYDAVEINNILYYKSGKPKPNCILLDRITEIEIVKLIDTLRSKREPIYTNYITEPIFKNSAFYMRNQYLKPILLRYKWQKIDSSLVFNQKEYLFKMIE
jgi:hypothetical protein